jgi:hypothetical protein
MKTKKLIIASLACVSVVLFSGCRHKPVTQPVTDVKVKPDSATLQADIVKRGSYLVTVLGCGDCHTPKNITPQGPEPVQALALSGYRATAKLPKVEKNALKEGWYLFTPDLNASVGPWGISYAANLTSDASGIGNWPEENFIRALRQGKFKGIEGGRTLLPPMPWQNLAQATDEDLKAIFAYLKSTPPVNNIVPMSTAPEDIK